MSYWYRLNISELKGKTLKAVVVGAYDVTFTTDNDESYRLYHSQDCCESVNLEEVIGDVADLVGHEIQEAEEESNSGEDPRSPGDESWTWTFYKIGTNKGRVTFRFYGTSNGYYSERVDFVKVD